MKQQLIGILGVFVIAGSAYGIYANTSGAKDRVAASISQDICSSITIGMRMSQVSDIALSKKGWFRAYAPDGARVGAKGWYSNCRCNVLFKDGGVTSVSKSMCIN
jgi:hypothetical protein